MEWPGEDLVPVVFAGRPGRNRGRLTSEQMSRQKVYVQDANGLLVPAPAANFGAGLQRSISASGNGRRSPTQIFITNQNRDDHSPVRGSRRHSRHGHQHDDSDSDWDDRAHSPPRNRRHRPRSRAPHHNRKSRSPSPLTEKEIEKRIQQSERMKRLDEIERKEQEEEQERKFERKFEQMQILKAAEAAQKKKEEEEMRRLAVEEYNKKQAAKAAKEKQEKEEADRAFRERVKTTFGAAGYSEKSIEQILEKEGKGSGAEKKIMDLTRPTYIKVHRKHLSPDTLDLYGLPWEWDDVSYIFLEQSFWFHKRRRRYRKRM